MCKGKVAGYTYICPSCDALYCQKCADALIKLDNICWVCNEPLDPSKPIKPYKFDEDEEIISPTSKTNKKIN